MRPQIPLRLDVALSAGFRAGHFLAIDFYVAAALPVEQHLR